MKPRHGIISTHAALRLRKAAARDIADIVELEQLSFLRPKERFERRTVRRLIGNPRAEVLVAVHGRRVLGWIAGLVVHRGERRWGRIYAVAVHPQARGLRVGRRLMERAMRRLAGRGAERISLEVRDDNTGALALYKKLGFEASERLPDYYGPGYHGVRMILIAR